MGLLVTQKDGSWVIGIREKWYFEKSIDASRTQLELMNMNIPFTAGIESVKGKKNYTISIVDAEITVGKQPKLFEVFTKLVDMKELYGQRPQWL